MTPGPSMTIDLLAVLREVGALKEGHFVLSSGRHADRYIEKFDLLRNPRATSEVCRAFAERFAGVGADVVVGPTTGGILLAFEVARQLGLPAAYAERRSETGRERTFRRGQSFAPGTRVVVVDDIMTTGGAVKETLAALAEHPVDVVGTGVLVDRSGGSVDLGVPLFAIAELDIATWDPADCPLCRDGVPLVKPGTTPTAATDR